MLHKRDLLNLLRSKGINVNSTCQNMSGTRGMSGFDFDILAISTNEIVIVEVKTTLQIGDVKEFLKKLNKAKIFMPEYRSMSVYGAVAFLQTKSACEVLAESKGLFVIRATGSSAAIINKEDFVPKTF